MYNNTVVNTLSKEKCHHTVHSSIHTLTHLSKSFFTHKCIHEYISKPSRATLPSIRNFLKPFNRKPKHEEN